MNTQHLGIHCSYRDSPEGAIPSMPVTEPYTILRVWQSTARSRQRHKPTTESTPCSNIFRHVYTTHSWSSRWLLHLCDLTLFTFNTVGKLICMLDSHCRLPYALEPNICTLRHAKSEQAICAQSMYFHSDLYFYSPILTYFFTCHSKFQSLARFNKHMQAIRRLPQEGRTQKHRRTHEGNNHNTGSFTIASLPSVFCVHPFKAATV